MDNHYHLLVQTPDSNLSKGMRHLNGVYTQVYNRRHNAVGHLFQGRYKGIVVDEEAYLLELSRYIVLNPVKAKMVKHVSDWPWSSYQPMTGEIASPEWLSCDSLLLQFSKQRKTAIKRFKEFVDAGIKNGPIWGELKHQIYLGDDAFVEKMTAHLSNQDTVIQIPKIQRRSAPKPIGYYEKNASSRNKAILDAYLSGGYSYQELGNYFKLHFTSIGKVIRRQR